MDKALVEDILRTIMEEQSPVSSVLLNLKTLTHNLNGNLEKWIKLEYEGYPGDINVPLYRKLPLYYIGTFAGAGGAMINNAPVPINIINSLVKKDLSKYDFRLSIGTAEKQSNKQGQGNIIGVDMSNLMSLLSNKVYQHYSCIKLEAYLSGFTSLIDQVRFKALEICLKLYNDIPEISKISLSTPTNKAKTNQIVQQTIGNVIINMGDNAHINQDSQILVQKNDSESLLKCLMANNMDKNKAEELVKIASEERPESNRSYGQKVEKWLESNKSQISSLLTIIKTALKIFYHG